MGFGFWVLGLGFRVGGLGFGVRASGSGVEGLGWGESYMYIYIYGFLSKFLSLIRVPDAWPDCGVRIILFWQPTY